MQPTPWADFSCFLRYADLTVIGATGRPPLPPGLRKQPEDGEGILCTNVNLAVGNGRNAPLHGGAGRACPAGRAAEEQCPDVICVVSVQDRGCVARPAAVIDDPDNTSRCAIRGD